MMAASRNRSAKAIAVPGDLGSGRHRMRPQALSRGANGSPNAGHPRAQVAGIQRSRLLAAAVEVVDEIGYTHVTVAHITGRARVSRRTFYELFANREECLHALLEDLIHRVEAELAAAALEELAWRERIRRGLEAMLGFLDREPALARVGVVHAMLGGPGVLERRDRILTRLAAVVDEGQRLAGPSRAAGCSPLTAEGVVGAAFMIVHARLLRRAPLTQLLGELCGLIVLPYLGPAVARREQTRSVSGDLGHIRLPRAASDSPAGMSRDPLAGVAMRITYRTARVLEGVAEHPGASNREVAEHAEIQDPGQVSKLLARLERLGLLANGGAGHARGEPNAWTLTSKGELVAQSVRGHGTREREATW
jgi:AcrR family transcriptional regulator